MSLPTDLNSTESTSTTTSNNSNVNPQPSSDTPFQENIANTLKMLAESAKTMQNSNSGGDIDSSAMEKLIEGFEGNTELQSVMEGMVQQLISKDVLYEPMKELREKYPAWLEVNGKKLPEEDYRRYIKQYECVQKICVAFESADASQENIINLMQEMSDCGQPPQDIIQELAPGVQFGADGMPILPGGEGAAAFGGQNPCSIM